MAKKQLKDIATPLVPKEEPTFEAPFQQGIPGVDLKPISGDEQKFAGIHTVETIPDPAGNGDDIFKGTAAKIFQRAINRMGFDHDDNVKNDFKVSKEIQRKEFDSFLNMTSKIVAKEEEDLDEGVRSMRRKSWKSGEEINHLDRSIKMKPKSFRQPGIPSKAELTSMARMAKADYFARGGKVHGESEEISEGILSPGLLVKGKKVKLEDGTPARIHHVDWSNSVVTVKPYKSIVRINGGDRRKVLVPGESIQRLEIDHPFKSMGEEIVLIEDASETFNAVFLKHDNDWIHYCNTDTKEEAEQERKNLHEKNIKSIRLIISEDDMDSIDENTNEYVNSRLK